ncbi:lymphokine-activated killer T-cell-originated protein kinase [Anoplophora glabripennis]|uniref:lymphokine-activated killer T-cell-originated protein kinase n=1 Tax=Anoplophora glabripennis TaxID=217634 RepID=UPI000874F96F|nr:lymphokine-activated killer T-cell-originated protein kinase [Anoplophora glabripennis]
MDVFNTPVRRKTAVDQVQIPASPFLKKIGYGTGVAVYEMVRSPVYCKSRSPWAVKKLVHKQKNNVELNKRIKEEADVLRQLKHPNIVAFKAFAKDADGRNILVMEECSSCLGDMIENRSSPYSAKTIVQVMRDMATALHYLHNEALMMHCDVKSYNILVKGNFTICKLCDFGICLPVTKKGEVDLTKAGTEVEYVGTAAWSAPEILKYPQEITTKADVYALGLVIWEMIALAPPVDEEFVSSFNLSFDDSQVSINTIDNTLESSNVENLRSRPPLPNIDLSTEYNTVLEIFYCCTDVERDQRPTAEDIMVILQEANKNVCCK